MKPTKNFQNKIIYIFKSPMEWYLYGEFQVVFLIW